MFFIIFPAPKGYLAILFSRIKREEPIKKYCQVPSLQRKEFEYTGGYRLWSVVCWTHLCKYSRGFYIKGLGVQLLFSSERNYFTSLNLCLFLFFRSEVIIKICFYICLDHHPGKIIDHGVNSMIHYSVTLVGTIVDKFANSWQYISYQHKEKHIVLYDGTVGWAGERFGVPNSGNW